MLSPHWQAGAHEAHRTCTKELVLESLHFNTSWCTVVGTRSGVWDIDSGELEVLAADTRPCSKYQPPFLSRYPRALAFGIFMNLIVSYYPQ